MRSGSAPFLAPLLALSIGACGGGAPPPPRAAAMVRFVDDAPYEVVHAKCGGRELDDAAAHHVAPSPDAALAYAACADGAQLTGPIGAWVGRKLACTLTERSPLATIDEAGFTAEVRYPGGSGQPGLELVFSRTLQNGTDRDGFTGRWAEREQHADHVLYRHDEGDATLGGNCDDSRVRALVETLALRANGLVLRSEWKCGLLGTRAFRELRCTALP